MSLSARAEVQTAHRALVVMEALAADVDDATVSVFAQAARLMQAEPRTAPDGLLAAFEANYQHCVAADNDLGGWVVASVAARAAVAAHQPRIGLMWADRFQHHFEGLGGHTYQLGLELRGTLLAQAREGAGVDASPAGECRGRAAAPA